METQQHDSARGIGLRADITVQISVTCGIRDNKKVYKEGSVPFESSVFFNLDPNIEVNNDLFREVCTMLVEHQGLYAQKHFFKKGVFADKFLTQIINSDTASQALRQEP